MKTQGSETFGTFVVKTDEYLLLAKSMSESGDSAKQIALNIQAIDDMLSVQKIRSIYMSQRFTKTGRVRKDSHFLDFLGKRIDLLIQDSKKIKNMKK